MRMLFLDTPLVDYHDTEEFHTLHRLVVRQYCKLISSVFRKHTRRPIPTDTHTTSFKWSRVEEVSIGIASFAELHEHGPQILLTLTKKRGLRFILQVNEAIVAAVTATCRTYFCTLNERYGRRFYEHRPDEDSDIDAISLQHVQVLMQQSMIQVLGDKFQQRGFVASLHARSFAFYTHPLSGHVVCHIARARVCEYVTAFAMTTHARLGTASPGLLLNTDLLAYIIQIIDFH